MNADANQGIHTWTLAKGDLSGHSRNLMVLNNQSLFCWNMLSEAEAGRV